MLKVNTTCKTPRLLPPQSEASLFCSEPLPPPSTSSQVYCESRQPALHQLLGHSEEEAAPTLRPPQNPSLPVREVPQGAVHQLAHGKGPPPPGPRAPLAEASGPGPDSDRERPAGFSPSVSRAGFPGVTGRARSNAAALLTLPGFEHRGPAL